MINDALDFLVDELSDYILVKTGESGKIKLGKLATSTGNEISGDNTVICQLVNIEEERVGKAQMPLAAPVGGNFPRRNPELRLNICVLFSANPQDDPDDYSNSIHLLSLVIQFFQYKHFFTTENSPGLSSELGTLVMDLYPLSLENQNYLWGTLGVKYRPSVVYKVRLITILDDSVLDSAPAPADISINLKESN